MKNITENDAVQILHTLYADAKKSPYVRKPLAWALYQTWKKVNKIEKEREVEE